MKTLKYILLLILIFVIGGAIYIATLKNSYDVKRTAVIKAPLQVVFNNVNDYKNWPSWNPWLEQDTLAKINYSEITFGKDASYSWKSDDKDVGEGSMTTIDSKPFETINQHMNIITPWESESDIYWTFKPVAEGTEVTWGMKGDMKFGDKAYMAFSGGMDKMVGPDFEKGLSKLAKVIQADMKKFSVNVVGETTHGGGYYIYNTGSSKIAEFQSKMNEMMPQIDMYVKKNRIVPAGSHFSLYHKIDTENNAMIFSCAVPVSEKIITDAASGLQTGMLKPFKAVKVVLNGDYKNLDVAWAKGIKYIRENNLQEDTSIPSLEAYPTNPVLVPNPADWITEIYIPIKEEN